MDFQWIDLLPILGLIGTGYRGMKVGGKVVGGKLSASDRKQFDKYREKIAGGGDASGRAQKSMNSILEKADKKRKAQVPASQIDSRIAELRAEQDRLIRTNNSNPFRQSQISQEIAELSRRKS